MHQRTYRALAERQRNPIMNKIAVTIPDAIALAGIGRSTLYRLFSEGALTPRKAGRRTLILVDELERYLKALPAGRCGNDR